MTEYEHKTCPALDIDGNEISSEEMKKINRRYAKALKRSLRKQHPDMVSTVATQKVEPVRNTTSVKPLIAAIAYHSRYK